MSKFKVGDRVRLVEAQVTATEAKQDARAGIEFVIIRTSDLGAANWLISSKCNRFWHAPEKDMEFVVLSSREELEALYG